ncbi:MAG: M48 family metalloprotease [Acidaminococcales bacterium]|jgi:hypothetical protein|nr:M48 family metalloprotease [Acidaminococcales bacterium]
MRKTLQFAALVCIFLSAFICGEISPARAGKGDKGLVYDGKNGAAIIENYYGTSKDEAINARVEAIGRKLAEASERRDLSYVFRVLDGKMVNAFSCPLNYIFVFRGLADFMPDDAELAGALAHEIAHFEKGHISFRSDKAVAGGERGKLRRQKMQENHEHEYQADAGGFYLALKAGYNPYGIFVTISKLSVKSGARASKSHPPVAERVDRLSALAKSENILPEVVPAGTAAAIQAGGWHIVIKEPAGGYSALARAWLLAGNLHLLKNCRPVAPEKFSARADGLGAKIYYDGAELYAVRQTDLKGSGFTSADALARWYVDRFREFAHEVEYDRPPAAMG